MLWVSDPTGSEGEPTEFSIDVVLLKPRSRGSVRLRSAAPADPPVINLPGLRETSDVERLAEAYARAQEVAHRPEVKRVCTDMPVAVRADELHGFIRAKPRSRTSRNARWGPHPTTARSSTPTAAFTVPSDQRGAMPDVPSGFPHIATIMIAERLSDRIASVLEKPRRQPESRLSF